VEIGTTDIVIWNLFRGNRSDRYCNMEFIPWKLERPILYCGIYSVEIGTSDIVICNLFHRK